MRKKKEITITAEGRDKGKKFLIVEMPSLQAEKWGYRALGAMARSGAEIPEHIAQMGMMGIVAMGFKALLGADFREAEPLLDELASCIRVVVPAMPEGRPDIQTEDIEEPTTWMTLRSEVFELHTGFSVAAWLSRTWAEAAEVMRIRREALRSTLTSQDPADS